MTFSTQELQQMKSLLSEQIRELEDERGFQKRSIESLVTYKKPFVASGHKEVVDTVNDSIRAMYRDLDKLDKKLAKLRGLQRSTKETIGYQIRTDRFYADQSRFDADDDGWTPSGDVDEVDLSAYEAPPPNEALVEASKKFRELRLDGSQTCTLMSSNEGWQDNKMENFVYNFNPDKLETKDYWPTPGASESILTHTGGPVKVVTLPYIEPIPVDSTSKATNADNPKDAIGSGKLPIHLWPSTATAMGCIGFLNGMLKYGRQNFRKYGIRASIYVDAAKRHLDAWFEGEEVDPDDKVPHLAAALACIAIIVDAEAAGKLTDDRSFKGGYRALVERLTPLVAHLKQHHESKDPKHWTIADNV